MTTYNLSFDLNALAKPQTIEDLIALAKEVRAAFSNIHGHMAGILAHAQITEAA